MLPLNSLLPLMINYRYENAMAVLSVGGSLIKSFILFSSRKKIGKNYFAKPTCRTLMINVQNVFSAG